MRLSRFFTGSRIAIAKTIHVSSATQSTYSILIQISIVRGLRLHPLQTENHLKAMVGQAVKNQRMVVRGTVEIS
jgi:hypothetical protein